MLSGKRKKGHKMAAHKRKKRLGKNRHRSRWAPRLKGSTADFQ